MRSKIFFGYLPIGVFRSKPCCSATDWSILSVQESEVVLLDHGNIPPSRIESLGLYNFSISISFNIPNPVHLGQAPIGELNEKDAGFIFGNDILQLKQVLFSEKKCSVP